MKKLEADGKEYFDGVPVEIYEGVFRGTFDMIESDASPVASGDEVVFVVEAQAMMPTFSSSSKLKGVKRKNNFKVQEVLMLSKDKLGRILDEIPRKEEEF